MIGAVQRPKHLHHVHVETYKMRSALGGMWPVKPLVEQLALTVNTTTEDARNPWAELLKRLAITHRSP